MENLPKVLSIVISFIDGHGISLNTAKVITWFGLIAVCFFIVSAITQFIDAKKRQYHEARARVWLNKLNKLKKTHNTSTSSFLTELEKCSKNLLKHEMILMAIHIKEKSTNNTQRMFSKYFFEIIDESLMCIINIVDTTRYSTSFFEAESVEKYLRQIIAVVRDYSPKVNEKHRHSYRTNYASVKKNFEHLLESLEKSNLESTKNEVQELIQVFEAAIFDFKKK